MAFLPSQMQESPLPDTGPSVLYAGGRWPDLLIAAVLFVLIGAVYFGSQDTIPDADSMWTVHVALSIVREGNTDLDEYAKVVAGRDYTAVMDHDGHLHSFFPLGTPIMAVPFVYAVDELVEHLWSVDLYNHLQTIYDFGAKRIELGIASLFSTLICVVVYFTGRLFMGRGQSLILVLVAAFCTSLWSTTSRGLWQHGPSILMLSTALFLILAAEKKPWLVQFASLPLAFSWVIRPTNVISIALLSTYVLIRFRRYFVRYLLWALLIAVPALAIHLSVYGSPLPPYYSAGRVGSNARFWEALAGNLVSPARGLLVYSPIFFLAVYGLVVKVKNSEFRLLDAFLLGILTFHWLAISLSAKDWWAGHCYGPRFLSDMIPYLLYFLIPSIRQLALPFTARKVPLVALFALLAGLSFFMHFRGATEPAAAFGWNWQYGGVIEDVTNDPTRLWDWSDPPFLRGLRPAALHVEPHALSLQVQQGKAYPEILSLVVTNLGDRDLAWQAETPHRVQIVSETGAHEGGGLDLETAFHLAPGTNAPPMTVVLDVDGYEPGIHSLGAILISASAMDGKPLRSSPVAIPITFELRQPVDQRPGNTALSHPHKVFMPVLSRPYQVQVAPPPDILVNGAAQSLAKDQIQAFHGAGWYDQEHLDAYAWRWAWSPAEIYIHSPTRRTVRLEAKPVAFLESEASQEMADRGTLNVTTNQQESVKVAVRKGQVFGLDLVLDPGWNVIAIESQAGNARPADLDPDSGDLRQLSFALDVINLIEE